MREGAGEGEKERERMKENERARELVRAKPTDLFNRDHNVRITCPARQIRNRIRVPITQQSVSLLQHQPGHCLSVSPSPSLSHPFSLSPSLPSHLTRHGDGMREEVHASVVDT